MPAAQLGQLAVVHGLGQVVGRGGGRQVQPQRDVHDEVLPVPLLVVEDPVVAEDGEAGQGDPVSHGAPATARSRSALAPARSPVVAAATAHGVQRCRRLVHPHPPHAGRGGQRGDRRGRRLPAVRRPRARRRRRAATPRNRLREAPISTGKPQPGPARPVIDGSARSSAQLCSAFLANPRPGSSTMADSRDAGRHRGVDPVQQLGPHIGDHVVVARQRVHVGAVPAPVHQDPRARRRRRPRPPSPGRPARRTRR